MLMPDCAVSAASNRQSSARCDSSINAVGQMLHICGTQQPFSFYVSAQWQFYVIFSHGASL
jgi:hypothetical protein